MISQLLRKKYPRNLFFLKTNQNIDKKLNKTIKNSKIILQPENDSFDPIVLNENTEAQVWGVVTSVIHGL